MAKENIIRLSATVSVITVLVSIALAAWCASFIYDITPWWRLTFLAIPPIATAWIAHAVHNATGKYAKKKTELLFCACIPGIIMGMLTLCCAFFSIGCTSGTNAMNIPVYTCLGITALSMAIALWQNSVRHGDGKHLVYAGRFLTIGFVAAWLHTGINTLWTLPEWTTTAGQIYMALGVGYFFIALIIHLVKSFRK